MRVKMNYLPFLFFFIFHFLAIEESMIRMETDENEQERYLQKKIHSLVRDSYSPLGIILREGKKKLLIRQ